MSRTAAVSVAALVMVATLIPAVGAAPAATATPAAAPAAAPKPPGMPPYPSGYGGPQQIDAAAVPGAAAAVSPRVVHPGGRITFSAGGATDDVLWSLTDMPGRATSGPCSASSPSGAGGRLTCTVTLGDASNYPRMPQWLVFTVGFRWRPSCFSNGCMRQTTFRAYIALLPAASSMISGSVRDRANHMLPNVAVTISGMGKRYATRTDGAGEFRAVLPPGTWTVTPSGRWDPPSRVVRLGAAGARADFRSPAAELDFSVQDGHLVNGVDWTTATASGLVWRSGTATAHTRDGTPLADRVVEFDAPYVDGGTPGSGSSRIVVCDATWRPLFSSSWRAERITDAKGRVGFTLLLGNEIGVSLFHGRLKDDVAALDVERIGLAGTVTGPSVPDIVTPLQNAARLGLPVPTLSAKDQGALQAALTEWWLAYRAGPSVGPAAMPDAGDFVPVRNAGGSAGGLAFYPAGNPAPLRAHLTSGAALPSGYQVAVLAFRQVPIDPMTGVVNAWLAALDTLPDLATWESQHGPAVAGYLSAAAGLGAGWLGGPYPPPATDATRRAHYARCVPGATPPMVP